MDSGNDSIRKNSASKGIKSLIVIAVILTASVLVLTSMSVGAYLHSRGTLTTENITEKFGVDGIPSAVQAIRNSTDEHGELLSIDLQIGFEELTTLEAKRADALQLNFLLSDDTDFVNTTVVSDGVAIPVKIRHDLDHLSGEKPSFRVNVDDGFSFLGMKRFSIQHPGTHDYLMERAFFNHLRIEGVLTPRSTFINVKINGEFRRIYTAEEHFTDNMLEFAESGETCRSVRWDEDNLWQWRAERDWVSI